jgi:hypothetical protein
LARGCDNAIKKLEATASQSRAIVTLSLEGLIRLANSDYEVLSTYGELTGNQQGSNEISTLRLLTEALLFNGYQEHIQFGTLSFTDGGLQRYGSCSLVLRDELIAHRSSVFQECSTAFVLRNKIISTHQLPSGYRASWKDRGKLCVAKLGALVTDDMGEEDFQKLIVGNGLAAQDHDFIEVHIFGPITIRTIERVLIFHNERKYRKNVATVLIKGLRPRLEKFGVELEIRQFLR